MYHVNGKGEDAGVVYSEMQGRENGSGDLMALRCARCLESPSFSRHRADQPPARRTQRCLFDEESGYRSETGGLMEALRVLTVDQSASAMPLFPLELTSLAVRDYHRTYYQPHNLTLLVTGKVAPTSLLSVLQEKVEPSLVKHSQTHGPKGPRGWKRPFLETGSRGGGAVKKGKKEEVVEFPEKDESSGEVQISWIGPRSTVSASSLGEDERLTGVAGLCRRHGARSADDLSERLAGLAARPRVHRCAASPSDVRGRPFTCACTEIDEPFCTDITFYSNDGETTVMSAYLSSVPTEHLSSIGPKLLSAIKRVAEDDGVDMSRMGMVVERARLRSLNQMETDASDALASGLVSDFLYGDRAGEDLRTGIEKEMERYDQLKRWTGERWASELKKCVIASRRFGIADRSREGGSSRTRA